MVNNQLQNIFKLMYGIDLLLYPTKKIPVLKISFCLLTFLLLFVSCNTNIGQSADAIKQNLQVVKKVGVDGKLQTNMSIFHQHFSAIKKYASVHSCSTQYAFLVDMAIHSGNKRFFVVDVKTERILAAGLVTHGSSTVQMKDGERRYSNENSSFCTSLGKYKIGEKYYGKFGLAYKLTGLYATNSHAYARAVVLHSHPYVPDARTGNRHLPKLGLPNGFA